MACNSSLLVAHQSSLILSAKRRNPNSTLLTLPKPRQNSSLICINNIRKHEKMLPSSSSSRFTAAMSLSPVRNPEGEEEEVMTNKSITDIIKMLQHLKLEHQITSIERLKLSDGNDNLSLTSIRKTLIGLEDTIIYNLIERAKLPLNSPAYKSSTFPGFNGSFMELLVMGTEVVQAQAGRYQRPEDVPFFPDRLPSSLVPHPQNCFQDFPPAAASVSVAMSIWDFYVNQFLPELAPSGDDGNYALSVASDIVCLQAISRRIHYGKYVAESKFRNQTEAYSTAIRANDKDTLTNLLTDKNVEEKVKQRVEKKAMVFGKEITLSDNNNTNTNYKINPSLVSRLYDEWVIPLTKDVEIEYLLRRLN